MLQTLPHLILDILLFCRVFTVGITLVLDHDFITMSASAQIMFDDLIISLRNIVGIVENDKFENLEARA